MKNSLIVSVINQSACSSCHAKGACSTADIQEKEIEINQFVNAYSPGQEVILAFGYSKGYAAVFYGYLLPFILVLAVLISFNVLSGNELAGGLASLVILVPYYLILYLFRHKMKKVFKIEIEEN